ncbi:MAG: FAD-dependent oxidoreductase [Alphaproteobacteria bacterium]|nr:FAD-dependent oxidoreductase [Alphaproteobacteria bacterium]
MSILAPPNRLFETNVPVLVIGAGACGICAALTAKENGAEVLIVERDEKPTGSSTLSTCLIPAAGTKLQKAAGVSDTPEKFAADLIAKAKNKNDPRMALWIAQNSAATVDWLIDTVKLPLSLLTGFRYPGHSEYRMHGSPNRTGTELMAVLPEAAARAGIDIVTSATVTDLYADSKSGRVGGVRLTRPDGRTEDIGCQALVLACNGFGGNPEMVRQYIPEIADAIYFGHVGNKGDAVKWGTALGAAVADMGGYQGHGAVTHPHGTLIMWGVLTEGGFQVNIQGKRFSNEVRGYSEQAVEVIAQPERVAWEIWDEAAHKIATDFQDYRDGLEVGSIKRATTIEELARVIGCPTNELTKTFADIVAAHEGRQADAWGRDFANVEPLEPPYYAARVTGALFHTQGGLVVNEEARVLRGDGTALPNLFAGGGAARGLSGPSRWGYLSGNGLLTATVLGRLAGRAAARMVR